MYEYVSCMPFKPCSCRDLYTKWHTTLQSMLSFILYFSFHFTVLTLYIHVFLTSCFLFLLTHCHFMVFRLACYIDTSEVQSLFCGALLSASASCTCWGMLHLFFFFSVLVQHDFNTTIISSEMFDSWVWKSVVDSLKLFLAVNLCGIIMITTSELSCKGTIHLQFPKAIFMRDFFQ